MMKIFIGILGVALFLFGISLHYGIRKVESQASLRDDTKKAFAIVDEDSPPPCNWEISTLERVMAENKSQAILIHTSNPNKKECESYLSLRAPGFDITPSKEEQKVVLPSQTKGSLSWIIAPRKTGTFDISVSDIINTRIFGINVTNVFGLTATQAKLFSMLSTIFGPMFTIPWWWDKFRPRKEKSDEPRRV